MTTTPNDVPAKLAPYVDVVAAALRLKLCHELGRHRAALYAFADLARQLSALAPELQTRATGASDPDDIGLCELLAERWPPGSIVDPLADLLPTEGCER